MEKETKQELIERAAEIQEDIERLQKIVDASSETTFEIILEDLKVQMIENVNMESWSTLKANIKEVDAIKGTQDFIAKQSTLLNKKKEELKDLNDQINNYQQGLFDKPEEQKELKSTGIVYNGQELYVGDAYRCNIENVRGTKNIYFVKESVEMENSYAIISDAFDGEKLLQYPKNLAELNNSSYVGNIFVEDDGQQAALDLLAEISASHKEPSSEENGDNISNS